MHSCRRKSVFTASIAYRRLTRYLAGALNFSGKPGLPKPTCFIITRLPVGIHLLFCHLGCRLQCLATFLLRKTFPYGVSHISPPSFLPRLRCWASSAFNFYTEARKSAKSLERMDESHVFAG